MANRKHSGGSGTSHLPLFSLAFIAPVLFIDVKKILMTILNDGVLGIMAAAMQIFGGLLQVFLFPPAPGRIPGLAGLWDTMVFVFFTVVSTTMLGYFGYMMLFSEDPQADPFRMFNRLFIAVIAIVAGRPLLNAVFSATNALGQFIFPNANAFRMSALVNASNSLVLGIGGQASEITLVVGLALMYLMGVSSIVIFFVILALRTLILYTVFALFPLFMALWVVDVGPFEYGKQTADIAFKAFGLLLAFGILMSAILATGAAISSGAQEPVDVEQSYKDIVNKDYTNGAANAAPDSNLSNTEHIGIILIGTFGSIWASIAVGTSALGMLISVRGNNGPGVVKRAQGVKRGYRKDGGVGAIEGFSHPQSTRTDLGGGMGGTGGGRPMPDEEPDAGENAVNAGPTSLKGKKDQAIQDWDSAEGWQGKSKLVGSKAYSGFKSAAVRADRLGDKIKGASNQSIASLAIGGAKQTGKLGDAYKKGKQLKNGTSGSIETVKENQEMLDGDRVNLDAVEYDADEQQFVDDAGNRIDYDDSAGGPDNLEEGKRYNVRNADFEVNNGNAKIRGHDRMQAKERNSYAHAHVNATEGTTSGTDTGTDTESNTESTDESSEM